MKAVERMPGRARTVVATCCGIALAIALAGCGTPPWEKPGANGSATPTASPGKITVIDNDLATGSTRRILHAGDVTLDVKYYSSLAISQWTPSAQKPLSLSATATLGTDQGQAVYLSNEVVAVTVHGPNGTLPAPSPQSDQASVSPGYYIKAPYSYAPTFLLPPVDGRATSLTVTILYDLLVQTTPTSADFQKVSAADTLTIALTH
jgi:hypothetical protein